MAFGGRTYLTIQSKLSNMVLDVRGAVVRGTAVILYPYNDGRDSQLWSQDTSNAVIRSKLNPRLVLEMQGDTLILNDYNPYATEQKWVIEGDRIHHLHDSSRVLDVANCNMEVFARVCSWSYNGGNNQRWTFTHRKSTFLGGLGYGGGASPHGPFGYASPTYGITRPPAYGVIRPPTYGVIRSHMNNKVVDIKGADPSPGAELIMWDQHGDPADNQLWYQDNQGIIHSKLNDFVFDSSDPGKIRMQPYYPNVPQRQWTFRGNNIVNVFNQCLDIIGAKMENGANLCAFDHHGNINQRWTFGPI